MELSVAIQAKVEVTPSNWNFGFQPTPSRYGIENTLSSRYGNQGYGNHIGNTFRRIASGDTMMQMFYLNIVRGGRRYEIH